MKRPGRPKKETIQQKFLGFYVTHVQHLVIQHKAKQAGVNISDYMRQVAVHASVKTRWTEEERGLFKDLVGLSNALNELVLIARREGSLQVMLQFQHYRTLIDVVIKQLGHDK